MHERSRMCEAEDDVQWIRSDWTCSLLPAFLDSSLELIMLWPFPRAHIRLSAEGQHCEYLYEEARANTGRWGQQNKAAVTTCEIATEPANSKTISKTSWPKEGPIAQSTSCDLETKIQGDHSKSTKRPFPVANGPPSALRWHGRPRKLERPWNLSRALLKPSTALLQKSSMTFPA